ncbi:MAG TPA: hypothetical protein VEK07_03090 [Polyangiaceae bacterium]|nr:hypothetical protein [Polyangiaceae bacterium]
MPPQPAVLSFECDADVESAEAGPAESCSASSFGPAVPVQIDGVTNAGATGFGGLRLSPDYLTGYFYAAGLPASAYDFLYSATRCAPPSICCSLTRPFGSLTPLLSAVVNPVGVLLTDPTVSGDGVTLVFAYAQSSTPGSQVHLWSATRQPPYPFSDVGPLASANSSSALHDESPFLIEDGGVLYFASDRNPDMGTDLYRATFDDDGGGTNDPTPVTELNTAYDEVAPVVTPDDLTIYYASNREDTANGNPTGELHIWVATRNPGDVQFQQPANVSELNSSSADSPTFVTRDGCTLYFSSTRSGILTMYVATKSAGP